MSYEIIEKTQYGVLVKKMKSIPTECEKCKYTGRAVTLDPCKSCKTDNSYYLPDQEAAKLETEITPETFTINDLYVESKLLFDCQDELKALQIENKQLKERIEELETYLDKNIEDCIEQAIAFKYQEMYMSQQCSSSMQIAYQNVKEFIKNQK